MFDQRAALLIIFIVLCPRQVPDKGNVEQMVQRAVKLHQHWSDALGTPGSSAEAREVSRKPGDGYTAVTYNIFVQGLPPNKVYDLYEVEVTTMQVKISVSGITIGKDGIAICAGRPGTCGTPTRPDDPIALILPSFKGQARHLGLVSKDGQSRVQFLLVPFPVRSQDNGCQLEIERLIQGSELIYVSGSGFPPGAAIKLEGTSEGEKQSQNGEADSQGSYNVALLPGVKGKTSGTVHVTLQGPTCAPSGYIEWGKESVHYE